MDAQTSQSWMGAAGGRDGFVLPMAMFILLVLTVLALGAYFIANQEVLMGTATKNAELAFYVAESGAVEVMSDWDGGAYNAMNAFDTLSESGTFTDGTYTLTVTRMSGNMYMIDATSFITAGGLLRQGANRRLGYIVRTVAPDFDPPTGAFTTLGVMSISSTSIVTGADDVPSELTGVCLLSDGTTEEGIVSADTSLITLGDPGSALGDPAKYQSSSLDTTFFTDMGGLSWTEATALATHSITGGSITTAPDTTAVGICTQTTTTNWGNPTNPTGACGLYFPIIHVTGDVRLGSGSVGQGILLVEGDLTILGGFTFYGYIVVQDKFDSTGTNSIYGAVMSKNESSARQSIGGTTLITYSKCALHRAIGYSAAGLGYPIRGRAWIDLTTASY